MAAKGHVVSLKDGSSYPFDGETSEQDAEDFASKRPAKEVPIVKPLTGAVSNCPSVFSLELVRFMEKQRLKKELKWMSGGLLGKPC